MKIRCDKEFWPPDCEMRLFYWQSCDSTHSTLSLPKISLGTSYLELWLLLVDVTTSHGVAASLVSVLTSWKSSLLHWLLKSCQWQLYWYLCLFHCWIVECNYVTAALFNFRPASDTSRKDSCRFQGTLHTRKLSGNFHVTLGK